MSMQRVHIVASCCILSSLLEPDIQGHDLQTSMLATSLGFKRCFNASLTEGSQLVAVDPLMSESLQLGVLAVHHRASRMAQSWNDEKDDVSVGTYEERYVLSRALKFFAVPRSSKYQI